MCHAGGRAGPQHRPKRRPRRGVPRVGPLDHHRPPVRVLPAGAALRGPGRHGGRLRRRDRRRDRAHDAHAHGVVGGARPRVPLRPQDDGALRRARRARVAGHLGRDDRRPVGASRQDLDAFGARSQQARRPGHRRGPLRAGDPPPRREGRRGRRRPTRSSPPTRGSAPTPPRRSSPT